MWSKAHTEWKSREGAPYLPKTGVQVGLPEGGGAWAEAQRREGVRRLQQKEEGKRERERDWGFGAVAPVNLRI